MQSMTGYGYASAYRDERELAVEIRTVNHRFLDLNIRMPRSLLSMEDVVRKQVSAALSRGHVDITVTYQNHREDASFVELNVSLLSQYVHAVEEMVLHYLPDETDLPPASYYASIPGVLTEKNSPEDEEAVTGLLCEALSGALGRVKEMRGKEGDALLADLSYHLHCLSDLRNRMEVPAKEAPALYAKQLAARIQALGVSVQEDRLAQEVALFSDRTAVDEELSRLKSHISQMEVLLSSAEPVGKKLDFLIQEMNREANTIASKSPVLELTDLAVKAKNEIEKLREQIQNAE